MADPEAREALRRFRAHFHCDACMEEVIAATPAPDTGLRAEVLVAFDDHRSGHGESCDCALGIVIAYLADIALATSDGGAEERLRAAAERVKADHDANGHREPCDICAALSGGSIDEEEG